MFVFVFIIISVSKVVAPSEGKKVRRVFCRTRKFLSIFLFITASILLGLFDSNHIPKLSHYATLAISYPMLEFPSPSTYWSPHIEFHEERGCHLTFTPHCKITTESFSLKVSDPLVTEFFQSQILHFPKSDTRRQRIKQTVLPAFPIFLLNF